MNSAALTFRSLFLIGRLKSQSEIDNEFVQLCTCDTYNANPTDYNAYSL